MPGGIPVATMAIGTAGAKNAALLAGRILALQDATVRETLHDWIARQTAETLNSADL
jgi:5-(carboxyamino)imidazole ribonucleotide mutase